MWTLLVNLLKAWLMSSFSSQYLHAKFNLASRELKKLDGANQGQLEDPRQYLDEPDIQAKLGQDTLDMEAN